MSRWIASFTPEMEAVTPDTIWEDFFTTPDLTKERNIVLRMIQHLNEQDRLLFANLEAPQEILADMMGIHVSNVCRKLQALQEKLIAIKDVQTQVTTTQWANQLSTLSTQESQILDKYAKILSIRETAKLFGISKSHTHNLIKDIRGRISPEIGQLLEYCLEHRVPLRACLLEEPCQQEDQAPLKRSIASE